MESVSLGLAFSAGMLAVINPCAISMIPAYVALRAQAAGSRPFPVVVLVGTAGLAAGFVGVFVAVALALGLFGRVLLWSVPYVASAVGLTLFALGVWVLLGRRLHVSLPAVDVRGGADSPLAQLLFGATYALASLGCAFPIFLAFAAMALGTRDLLALAASVGSFALGSATALLALVAVAAGAQGTVRRLPRAGSVARYAGGALVAVSGLYVLYVQLGFLIGYPLGIPALTLPL